MKPQTPESAATRIASAPAHYTSMITADNPRFAVIRGARTVKEALAYLPSNYDLMESFEVESQKSPHTLVNKSLKPELIVIIGGYDSAGWTLDDYVIPRLASGLMFAEEIPA